MTGMTLFLVLVAGALLVILALRFASGVLKVFLRLFLLALILFILWLVFMVFKVGPFMQKM